MKTVYYHPWQKPANPFGVAYRAPLDHPLFMKGTFIPPTTYLQYLKDQNMWEGWKHEKCPALGHFGNNTFVMYAQNDVDYSLNENNALDLLMDAARNTAFDNIVFDSDFKNDQVILQMYPAYVLWTEHKEAWVEQLSIPNGPVAQLPGTFPLGKWSRPLNPAIMSKVNQRVTVKRGDALFMIRFPDRGEKYQLKMKRPSEKEMLAQEQHVQLKQYLPHMSWSIMNKKEEKKCPFRKFW